VYFTIIKYNNKFVVADKHRLTVDYLCCHHERRRPNCFEMAERQRRRPNSFELAESKIKAKKDTTPSLSRSSKKKEFPGQFIKHFCNHEHNLWRATKYLKRPAKRNTVVRNCNSELCRSDAEQAKAFAQHLHSVFQQNDIDNPQTEREVHNFLESPNELTHS